MILLLAAVVAATPASTGTATPVPISGSGADRPVGVLLSASVFDIDQRVDVASRLGANYLRQPVTLTSWDGTCPECPAVRAAGLEFVLTLRNTGDVRAPSAMPADMAAYKELVGRAIDAYEPALVAVENEENSLTFYSSGPQNYVSQLEAACEVAHDRGIACTNGGLLSGSIKYFVYQNHVDAGKADRASSYANRSFESWQMKKLSTRSGRTFVKQRAREVQVYLDAYATSTVDFLNIHWYHVSGSGLKETVRILGQVTGLQVLSNEMGQRNLDPDTTREMLETALDAGMPLVIWYGSDARLAKGLVERDGSLRDTGRAFRDFLRSL